eukprot:609515-Rhodomonas_salina.1
MCAKDTLNEKFHAQQVFLITSANELKQESVTIKHKLTDSITKQRNTTRKSKHMSRLLLNSDTEALDRIARAATHPEPRVDVNRVPDALFQHT